MWWASWAGSCALQHREEPAPGQGVPGPCGPREAPGRTCERAAHSGAGEECEKSTSEEEGAAETACDDLTATPIPGCG